MKREFLRGSVSTAALLVYLSLSAPVLAQSSSNVEWIGPAGPVASEYNDGSQWDSGAAPTSFDATLIGNGGSALHSAGSAAAGSLTLDADSGLQVGLSGGVPATMFVGGKTSVTDGSRLDIVGTSTFFNTNGLEQSGGSISVDLGGTLLSIGDVSILSGGDPSAHAVVLVQNNSQLNTAGDFAIGDGGIQVAVRSGSSLRGRNLTLGNSSIEAEGAGSLVAFTGASQIDGGSITSTDNATFQGGVLTVNGGHLGANNGIIDNLATRLGGPTALASIADAVNGGVLRAGSVLADGTGSAPALLQAGPDGTVETNGITAVGPAASVGAFGAGSLLRDSQTATILDGAFLGLLGGGSGDFNRVNIVNGGFSVDQSTATADKLTLASGMAAADVTRGSTLNTNGTTLNDGAVMNVDGSTLTDTWLTTADLGSEIKLKNGAQANLGDLQLRDGSRTDVDASSSLTLNMGQSGGYSYVDGSLLNVTGRFTTDGNGLDDNNRAIGFVVGAKSIGSRVVYSDGAQADHRTGVVIAEQAGGTGEIIATGQGTRIDTTSLEIGRGGRGNLRIEGGAQVNASSNVTIGGTGVGRGDLSVTGAGSKLTAAALSANGDGNISIGVGAELVSGRAGNSFFPWTSLGNRVFTSASDSHATKNTISVDGKLTLLGGGTVAQFGNGGQADIFIRNRGVMTAEGRILLGSSSQSFTGAVLPGSANLVIDGGSVTAKGLIAGRDAGSLGNVTVRGDGAVLDVRGAFASFGVDGFSTLQVAERGIVKADVLNVGGVVDPADKTGKLKGIGSGKLVVGALPGQAAVAPGVIDARSVNLGKGGALVFNHNSSAYAFAPTIEGSGSVSPLAGRTIFAGTHTYSGKTTIGNGATLHSTGWLQTARVDVQRGGTLSGWGTIDGTLANAGLVAIGAGLPTGQYSDLHVGTYESNGGILAIKTRLDKSGSPSDKLIAGEVIMGTGATGVIVTNTDGLGAPDAKITVVDVTGGASKSAKGAFELVGRAAAGGHEYGLERDAEGNYNLRSKGLRVEAPLMASVPDLARHFGMAVLGTSDDRRGRLPEFLQGGPSDHVGWARAFGNFGSRKGDMLAGYGPSYESQIGGIQAGYDLFRNEMGGSMTGSGGFYVAAGSASADVKTATNRLVAGQEDLTGYSVGGYYTLNLGGPWVGVTVQGTRYDVDTQSVLGQSSGATGYGVLASVEGGMPLALGGGWVVEPQAQVILQRESIGSLSDAFGRAAIEDQTVVTGRVGMRVAKSFALDNGMTVGIWGRGDLYQTGGNFGNVRITDLQGNWPVDYKASSAMTTAGFEAGVAVGFKGIPVKAFAAASYNADVAGNLKGGHDFGARGGLEVRW